MQGNCTAVVLNSIITIVTDANLGRLLNGHVITELPAKRILVNGDVSWAAR